MAIVQNLEVMSNKFNTERIYNYNKFFLMMITTADNKKPGSTRI
jgi:hypothetical protein